MVLTVAHINHSCAGNSTIAEAATSSTDLEVMAEKAIAEGEEVFISYKEGLLQNLTSWQRKALLRASYGFECSREICCLGSKEL